MIMLALLPFALSLTSSLQAQPRNSPVVPTGTEIAVRTNDAIDSQNASEGQTHSATVLQDIKGNAGETLIPKGSDPQLVIRQVNLGGTTGSPQLILDLQSITVNGRRYRVSTEDISQTSNAGIGKNRRTAEMVGGGAVLGTLLGAIAGGGKGATIGAIAGGAAGGTAQVLTRGRQVKVPAVSVGQTLRLGHLGILNDPVVKLHYH
jgi:hypothetical protein